MIAYTEDLVEVSSLSHLYDIRLSTEDRVDTTVVRRVLLLRPGSITAGYEILSMRKHQYLRIIALT